jgi:hypothetical protein
LGEKYAVMGGFRSHRPKQASTIKNRREAA